jgi:hypothetical protein
MSSSGIYGFNSSSQNTFYLQTNGTFQAGRSNDYIRFDGSDLIFSTTKSGGGITIKAGADLILEGGSAGNPSLIKIQDGTVPGELRFVDDSDTSEYYRMYKRNLSGGFHDFYFARSSSMTGNTRINIGKDHSSGYVDALTLTADVDIDIRVIGAETSYILVNHDRIYLWSDELYVESGAWIGIGSGSPRIKFTSSLIEPRHAVQSSPVMQVWSDHGTFDSSVFAVLADRSATTGYNLIVGTTDIDGSPDTQFNARADGNTFCDLSFTGGGADYAEYFEWEDGNIGKEDRSGVPVVLSGSKVRPAIVGEEDNIIGVTSVTPSCVGNSAQLKWHSKFIKDKYGRYELDQDGYRQLNPVWDENEKYIPREERAEWVMIALVGRVRVNAKAPINPTWIKLREIDGTVFEYLIK